MIKARTCEAAMVDPISNAPTQLEIGQAQNRPQASPQIPGTPNPATNLGTDQRVEGLQSAVEKLIKKSLPPNSRLLIVQDKTTGAYIYQSVDPETGEVINQYPPEQLVKMHDYLATMSGMIIDTKA
jgi:flagellar protein FlaG